MDANAQLSPIGVFDSGIGGLSTLRALRAALPSERFVYLADSGFAPYGERDPSHVLTRSRAVTRRMREEFGIKALVVACNTATAAAIHALRHEYPGLPLVGVEPALKPAVASTRTGHVGVIATRGTLAGAKFAALLATVEGHVRFAVQPCDGLAAAIENDVLPGCHPAVESTRVLCDRYLRALGRFGTGPGEIDTLVMGCTHYEFADATLRDLVGPGVALIETGTPVARQTRHLLTRHGLLAPAGSQRQAAPVAFISTGDAHLLHAAAARWLGA
jgi:glutamate racemase